MSATKFPATVATNYLEKNFTTSRNSDDLHILLVEDNPGDVRLIQEYLNEAFDRSYSLVTANTLATGQQYIAEKKLDAVLLDLSLPDSQGLDTFNNVYKCTAKLPIIVLTGLDDESAALEALQNGAQDYLSKNAIDSKVLKRSIQYAVQRQHLEEKNQLQAAALQATANAVFITDEHGIIEWINPAFTHISGYEPEDVLGKTPSILKSGSHLPKFYEDMWVAIKSGQVWRSDVVNRHKNGSLFYVEQTITPLLGHDNQVANFVAIQQDISTRKQAELDQVRRVRELEALNNISTSMRTASKVDDALAVLMDETLAALSLDTGTIWLHDLKSQRLHEGVSRGWFQEIDRTPMESGDGIAGNVFKSGKTYSSVEFLSSTDAGANSVRRKQIPAGWGGVCVPIQSTQSILGVMFVSTQVPRQISAEEIKLVEMIANMVGVTIERLQMLENTQRYAEKLEIINEVGRALSESLDLNDIYARLQRAIYGLISKVSTVIFSLYDTENQLIIPGYAHHDGQVQDISTLQPISLEPPGSGLQSQVIRTRQILIDNQLRKDIQKKAQTIQEINPSERNTQSSLYVPMLAKERVVGVINLQSFEDDYFTQEHADLLSVIGNTAAVAIENAHLFKQTEVRLKRLNSLRSIDQAITSSQNLEIILDTFLDEVLSQLKVDAACVLLFNPTSRQFEYAHGKGFNTQALQYTKLSFGEGYAGKAALNRTVLEIREVNKRKTDFHRSSSFVEEGFIVYFCTPLIAKGQVNGVLEVFLRSDTKENEEWRSFLEALAGQAAIAVDNARLFQDLNSSHEELVNAYDDTIEGWSRAMDLRDEETEGHTRRVTELTLILAKELGFSFDELVHIRRGALLHDIGKMGIPDKILLKPAKLTEEEWRIMRKHPEFAFEMLQAIEYLRPALEIPYCHHEKWDGSGYPRGLKGTDIPFAARVFAIIDVYDALTSDRPYRKAWSEERTLAYIKEQSGTYFDPNVVDAFLEMKARLAW